MKFKNVAPMLQFLTIFCFKIWTLNTFKCKKNHKLYTDTPKSQRIKKNPPNKQLVVRNGQNDIDNVTRKKRRHDHGNRIGKHRQRHNRDAAKGDCMVK